MAEKPKLAEYHAKRDFQKTPEPSGGAPSAGGNTFIVQKHHATNLHYDFRLELDGVLVSWAVPKGLSMKANEKRFAARTEDHPLDYGGFEGVIPKGEYGGGTVLLWDRGTWKWVEGKVGDGKLVVDLTGEKLRGRFHMVRTKVERGKEQWLVFKGRDADARDEDVTLLDKSVLSGRTLEEIKAGAAPVAVAAPSTAPAAPSLSDLVKQIPTAVKLTNLDKVLYPESGLTKAAVIAYYASMADRLLPFVAGRPMTLLRCPDGRTSCFFQKHGTTPLLEQIHKGGDWLLIKDAEGLIACAQMAVLELHVWACRADDLEHPDLLVMDLDPDPAVEWKDVCAGAVELRARMKTLGLESFVKTTGGKGLHVVAPFAPEASWDELKTVSKVLAESMAADAPGRFTTNPQKAARKGKTYVDYLRNVKGSTAVAAWSPRAREGATVSCPVAWSELPGARPGDFTLLTAPMRKGDVWAGFEAAKRQPLIARSR